MTVDHHKKHQPTQKKGTDSGTVDLMYIQLLRGGILTLLNKKVYKIMLTKLHEK